MDKCLYKRCSTENSVFLRYSDILPLSEGVTEEITSSFFSAVPPTIPAAAALVTPLSPPGVI